MKLHRLGIGAGRTFAFKDLSPEQQAQVALVMKEGDAGIYGNDAVEATYPFTKTLANGDQPLPH
jgi:hypothetical protein